MAASRGRFEVISDTEGRRGRWELRGGSCHRRWWRWDDFLPSPGARLWDPEREVLRFHHFGFGTALILEDLVRGCLRFLHKYCPREWEKGDSGVPRHRFHRRSPLRLLVGQPAGTCFCRGMKRDPGSLNRRVFTRQLLASAAATLVVPGRLVGQGGAPAIGRGALPGIPQGVASGDVAADSAIIWSRTDRVARMAVEWDTTDQFRNARRIIGATTGPEADFTAKVRLIGLPAGQRIFYRVRFENEAGVAGDPEVGLFQTASTSAKEDVRFAWSGDTCGQGWGIDEARGGMSTYRSILAQEPQFFIHSGDNIYADNPIPGEVRLPDGSLWRNRQTEEKSRVAQTLADFRGNFRYNLLDAHVRAMQAGMAVFTQWDDHEVLNNWYPGQNLAGTAFAKTYTELHVDTLSARAKQAFFDYTPVAPHPQQQIYRQVSRGPLCDLFLLDFRTYRGANSANRQSPGGPDTVYMGAAQLAWLKDALVKSKATWKILCADMPLGLVVGDASSGYDALANGDPGAPLGRELELAELLAHLKQHRVRNTIWLTADVHYCASHHFSPARAKFTEFDPFWEFVSGPLHAGCFGPNAMDATFGPEVRFTSRKGGEPASGPWSKNQFFGVVHIDAATRAATVTHRNRDGEKLWDITLPPES